MRFDTANHLYWPALPSRPPLPYKQHKIDEDNWKLTFPVPGVAEKNLEITKEKNNLIIEILEIDGDERFFHFNPVSEYPLSNHIEIKDARLDNGLLQINLIRNLPEELKPQKILLSNNKKK